MPLIRIEPHQQRRPKSTSTASTSFASLKSKSETLHRGCFGPGNVYAVEESPDVIAGRLEEMASLRISNAIKASGLVGGKPA